MRILGIDPGSRLTGYGLIDRRGKESVFVAAGVIRMALDEGFLPRVGQIFFAIKEVIETYRPDIAVIESVFMHKNPGAALKLGQARGAAVAAMMSQNITVAEYSPREIKLAVVGYGAAKKDQVQHMIRVMLKLNQNPSPDAADALAVALCHAHTLQGQMAILRAQSQSSNQG
jgi:crossover junction endodeoxyribonuclease RuvC